MSLLTIVFVIVCFGLLVYAINRWAPLDPPFKQFITWVVIAGIVFWIFFTVFGGSFPDIKIGG